jgi:hypothetical protein
MENILCRLIKLSNKMDKLGLCKSSDDLCKIIRKLSYVTEENAASSEMQQFTDDSRSSVEHAGLFKKIMQQPISFVSRVIKPEIVIDAFINGANMEDLISRSSMELGIISERLKSYEKELGIKRLSQLGTQEILKMMNDSQIEAIWFSSPESLEHEKAHQAGKTLTPQQISQEIKQNLSSSFPAELDENQKDMIINNWINNYINSLKTYYNEDEIQGELGASEKEILDRALKEIPQFIQNQ